MFVLMQLPNAGDDLQAIKKGVMELADLDGHQQGRPGRGRRHARGAQITSALRLLGQHGHGDPAEQDAAPWQRR